MEEEAVEQTPKEGPEQVVRKQLQLEWVESEWFQVWLKLARGEYQQH